MILIIFIRAVRTCLTSGECITRDGVFITKEKVLTTKEEVLITKEKVRITKEPYFSGCSLSQKQETVPSEWSVRKALLHYIFTNIL